MTENKQMKLIKKASMYIDKKKFLKAARCLRSAYTENGKFNALIKWEPHTRDFSRELGDQASQRI